MHFSRAAWLFENLVELQWLSDVPVGSTSAPVRCQWAT